MRKDKKALLLGVIILLLVTGFLFNTLSLHANDFGQGDQFNSSSTEKNFNLPATEQYRKPTYFIHDQLIKLVLLLIFTGIAFIILLSARYGYRKIILASSIAIFGFYLEGFLCPLIAMQNVFIKWQTGYLLLFLVIVISALLYGRVFCGYICPFGAVQELLHLKKLSKKISSSWNRYLTKAKYVLLGYLVLRVLITGQVIFQDYTPFKALFTWGGNPLSIGLTLTVVLLSIIIYRPFCRYLCPLGAFLAVLSRFSLFKVKVGSNCVNCGLCKNVCKTQAILGKSPKINYFECILCGDCIRECPKKTIAVKRINA